MCAADALALESGFEDVLARPPTPEEISLHVHNLSGVLAARVARYRRALSSLLTEWTRCRQQRSADGKAWRAIFILGGSPRPATITDRCAGSEHARSNRARGGSGKVSPGLASGFGEASDVEMLNQHARELVEAAGFEVFDPFGASLHASAEWFDREDAGGRRAEPLADALAQMLLNQVCPWPSSGSQSARET